MRALVWITCLVAALAVAALWVRRRRQREARPVAAPVGRALPPAPAMRAAPAVRPTRRPPSVEHGGLAVGSTRVCPTCRAEHEGLTFCPRDARRLISPEDMLALAPGPGVVCPACGRAQEAGTRRCPHDGAELLPPTQAALARAWAPARPGVTQATGVIGKICPTCQDRFDLAARFCGHDGDTLVVIN